MSTTPIRPIHHSMTTWKNITFILGQTTKYLEILNRNNLPELYDHERRSVPPVRMRRQCLMILLREKNTGDSNRLWITIS